MVISDCLVACDASHVYIYIYISCFFLRVVEIFVLISAITHPNTNLHSQENKGSWNQIPTQSAKRKTTRTPPRPHAEAQGDIYEQNRSLYFYLELLGAAMVETGVLEAGWSVPAGVTRPKSSKGSDIGRKKKRTPAISGKSRLARKIESVKWRRQNMEMQSSKLFFQIFLFEGQNSVVIFWTSSCSKSEIASLLSMQRWPEVADFQRKAPRLSNLSYGEIFKASVLLRLVFFSI